MRSFLGNCRRGGRWKPWAFAVGRDALGPRYLGANTGPCLTGRPEAGRGQGWELTQGPTGDLMADAGGPAHAVQSVPAVSGGPQVAKGRLTGSRGEKGMWGAGKEAELMHLHHLGVQGRGGWLNDLSELKPSVQSAASPQPWAIGSQVGAEGGGAGMGRGREACKGLWDCGAWLRSGAEPGSQTSGVT